MNEKLTVPSECGLRDGKQLHWPSKARSKTPVVAYLQLEGTVR